jgi:hypothetical protein
MQLEPFNAKQFDKLFKEATDLYKSVQKELQGDKLTKAAIKKYQAEINDLSKRLVTDTAKAIQAYEKSINEEIKTEIKNLEQELANQKKRLMADTEDAFKQRVQLGQQGVKLHESLSEALKDAPDR